MSDGALDGIRVLDLGRYYQAPYAAFLMAMAGADVVKVEAVGGEPMRRRADPGAAGGKASFALAMLNSNKRGVSLDLKHPRGKELLLSLVEKADVLVENFAPGGLERLGLGHDVLREKNPRLIHASGTGYGRSGPDKDALALDPVVQASSGITGVTGPPDGTPYKAGPALVDFLGGTHLYGGVITALYRRERTGEGALVEVAMQEAVYPALASNLATMYYKKSTAAARMGNRHGAVAPYNLYRASDGHVAILCTTDDQWRRLAGAMGRPELREDPRFALNKGRRENLQALDVEVEAWTSRLTRAQVFAEAKARGVVAAPVRDLEEVMHDPHMHERGMLLWIDHPDLGRIVVPRSPIRLDGDVSAVDITPSAQLGEHNAEVYGAWLGLSQDELDALGHDGVI